MTEDDMTTETTIIEINGVKMEVDLRRARIVHNNLRIGSKVKILEKGAYTTPTIYPGVVVGFDLFATLPTITVAYIAGSFSSCELRFAAINEKSADKWELVPSQDDDLPVSRANVLESFDREQVKLERQIADLADKRAYFERMFGAYFPQAETVTE
jgi:hypothetical protein